MGIPSVEDLERMQVEMTLTEFVEAVTSGLLDSETDCWAILQVRGSDNRFVQFSSHSDGDIAAEVVSNRFLAGTERWSKSQRRLIEQIGWVPPIEEKEVILDSTSPSLNTAATGEVSWGQSGRMLESNLRPFSR